MKQFGKMMLLALGFGLLAVVLSSIPNHPAAAAGSAPVTVVGGVTGATPVPVSLQGTGNISGDVNAAQSGAWNVGVNNFPNTQDVSATQSGTWNVGINSTVANPVPITDVAPLQMYQASCESRLSFRDNLNSCIIGVPAGKRLVVQTMSVHAEVDPGVRVSDTGVEALGTRTILWLNVPFTGTTPGASDISQATQELRLYADGGDSSIEFEVFYNSDTTINDLRCTVVGYLVNLP